jgi:hypothetical protein
MNEGAVLNQDTPPFFRPLSVVRMGHCYEKYPKPLDSALAD